MSIVVVIDMWPSLAWMWGQRRTAGNHPGDMGVCRRSWNRNGASPLDSMPCQGLRTESVPQRCHNGPFEPAADSI
jgi:hypothetical protein